MSYRAWRVASRRTGVLILASVVAFTGFGMLRAAGAGAVTCSDTWKSAVSGNWNVGSNWSRGAVPSASDTVCITAAGTTPYTVTLDTTAGQPTVNYLDLEPASGSATLAITSRGGDGGSTLTATNGVTNGAHGTITLTNVAGSLTDAQDAGLYWGSTFANAGQVVTLSGAGGGTRELGGTLTNSATGTLRISTDTNLATASTTITNAGAVDVNGASLIADASGQTWTQSATGTITDVSGGRLDLTNGATFNQGGGAAGDVVIENGSTLHLGSTGSGTFVFHDSDTLTGNIAAGQSLILEGVGCTHDAYVTSPAGYTNAGSIDLTNAEGDCVASQSDSLIWSGTLTNNGTITTDFGVAGGDRALDGNLTNGTAGAVAINTDTRFDTSNTLLDNRGAVTIASGATLALPGTQTFNNDTNGTITNSAGQLQLSNSTLDVHAGTVGTAPVVLSGSSTLNLGGAGAGTFVMHDTDTLSGNVAAGQSIVGQGVGCDHDTYIEAAAGFTNAGSITLTNVRGSCSRSQIALMRWSGTLTNSGTITSNFGTAGGDRELDGNLTNTGTVAISTDTAYNTSNVLFDNKGSVVIASGATLKTTGGDTFNNDTGGSITNAAGLLDLDNSTFDLGAGSPGTKAVLLENSSTLNLHGAVASSFTFQGTGDTLNVATGAIASAQKLTIQGQGCGDGDSIVTSPAGFTNNGTIDFTNVRTTGCAHSQNAELDWSGTLTNGATGIIRSDFGVAGGARTLTGPTLTNSGKLYVLANTTYGTGTGTLNNAGTIFLFPSRYLMLQGDTFAQKSTGTLQVQIASATSSGSLRNPNGLVGLAGTLQVVTTAPYSPPHGTTFQAVTFNATSGAFATKTFSGHTYHLVKAATAYNLVAVDSTATKVTCSPSSVPSGTATSCTATVTDTGAGTVPSPAGTVKFTTSGTGTFTASSCTLVAGAAGTASCAVSYRPSAPGGQTITGTYAGSSVHASSTGAFALTVS